MFQLTTPLTPAPGRAGSVVVPGAGAAKGAVALPDFLSLALPAAIEGVPGKVRQDPAGGGEAVPGGAVIAPPAGHPDDAGATLVVAATDVAAIDLDFAEPSLPTLTTATASTTPSKAIELPKALRVVQKRDASPMETLAAQPVISPTDTAVGDTKKDMAVAESRPAKRRSAGVDLAPKDAAAIVVPIPAVALSAPEASIPVDTKTTRAVAVDASAPQISTIAAPTTAPARLGKDAAPTELVSVAPSTPLNESPVAAPPSALGAGGADEARTAPHPRRADAPGVSLGAVVRLLDRGAAPVFSAGPDLPTATVPSTPASTSPVATLPAMPASVAAFFASVGPRPVAVPLPDAAPRSDRRGSPESKVAAMALPLTAAPATPIAIQSAGQVFAEAIHAATGQGERTRRAPGEGDALGIAAAGPQTSTTSTPIATADRVPLDMTQPHWPAKMIERIEILRDAADAQDTRIKLIPDALGAIDVAMKRDGDTVHVHLAAERPETRAMIADAQPRLAELGEQRGLKIAASNGQSASHTGTQDFHQPRGHPAPQQPARPASARAGDSITSEDEGDQRLA